MQAFGLLFKSIGVLVVLVAAVVADPQLAVAAAVTYALAYTIELALYLKRNNHRPRQVQDFIPTPMAIATAMYHTGIDPLTALR